MKCRLFLILLLCIAPLAQADLFSFSGKKSTFLPADQAFVVDVHAVNQHTLLASFKVTPDYYLYRNKISFRTIPSGDRSEIRFENVPGYAQLPAR